MHNIFLILFGFSFEYSFDFIGKLFLSQITIIILFVFFFFKKREDFLVENKSIYIFGFFWLFGQIISDIINESEFVDFARGNVKIIITLFAFYVFDRISNYKNNFLINVIFWVYIVSAFMDISKFENSSIESIWKFGLGLSATFTVLFFDYIKNNGETSKLTGIIIFFIGIFSLLIGTRYLFLFNSITCYFIFLKPNPKESNYKKIFTSVIGFIFLFFIINSLYNYSLKAGFFGSSLTTKTITQMSGDYGVFLGGRNEILSSTKAIIDAPIIGHGSWAKDCKYIDYLNAELIRMNYEIVREYKDCQIPTHSVIFESWVNSGFFGFLFWVYILKLLIIKFKNEIIYSVSLNPIFVFILTMSVWDILFSPFGANRIILLPLYLVFLLKHKNLKKIN